MTDEDEFDERNPALMVMLGLLSLADDAFARDGEAPWPEPPGPGPRRDEGPLLR